MPLHVWLPRAHPIAPAPVSALMSGVMIKVAIYGLVRVLVEWVGVLPLWFGVLVLARRRALGGRRRRLRALPARPQAAARAALDRERRDHRARDRRVPAPARPRRRRRGPRSRSARRCCTPSTTRSSRRCSSSAPARSSGRSGSLELDRLGGLLRRMPWTGGAFLVGAMAIAGLPPLNGFASEWLTLQALLHVPAYGQRRRRHRRRDRARRARRDRRARRLLLRQGRRARAARPAADARRSPPPRRRRCRCGRRVVVPRRCACVVLGARARAALRPARRPRAVAGGRADAASACSCPAPARCRRSGSRSCSSALTAGLAAPARAAQRRARADLGVRPARRARARTGRAPASPSRCGSCSRRCCARSGRSRCGARAASCRRSPTAATSRT